MVFQAISTVELCKLQVFRLPNQSSAVNDKTKLTKTSLTIITNKPQALQNEKIKEPDSFCPVDKACFQMQ